MSYEISNGAFLGIPLREVVKALSPSIKVSLKTGGLYVLVDDKLKKLAEAADISSFGESWYCKSIDDMVRFGFFGPEINGKGPSAFFAKLLLTASGLSRPIFFSDSRFDLCACLSDRFLILPKIPLTIRGRSTRRDLVEVRSQPLQTLCRALAAEGTISVVDPQEDWANPPVGVACLKKALHILIKAHASLGEIGNTGRIMGEYPRSAAFGAERWMSLLLNRYLEGFGDSYTVAVVSTYCGDVVHDCGGMNDGEPYVAYHGIEYYDEEGWDDPRDYAPDSVRVVRDLLLGSTSGGDWQKLTPQFGG